MATSRKSATQAAVVKLELTTPMEVAKARIQAQMEKGMDLLRGEVSTPESYAEAHHAYRKWDDFNSQLLKSLFTTTELANEYDVYAGNIVMRYDEPTLGEEIADLRDNINRKVRRLDSILDRLELIPITSTAVGVQEKLASSSPVRTRKVFVVHGRDEIAKTALEVFLHENDFEPIVLHRQADEGLTIIEKFEKHSDVGYAFILLTPDEVAYLAADADKPDDKRNKEFRARPNVIFEFGYFVGKLSRSRVCCLYTGDVSLPSDVSGMIYKRYEKSIEEVAYSILKDLKAAGY